MSEADVAGLREDIKEIVKKLDRLSDRVDELAQAFARTSSAHSQRLKHVEGDAKLAHDRISTVKKWVLGGLIGIASMAVKYAWSIIESVARKG